MLKKYQISTYTGDGNMARRKKLDPSVKFISRQLRNLMKHTYNFPVTFIGAPTGYGKTILTESLNDDEDTYRINLNFNDINYFMRRLSEVIDTRFSDLANVILSVDDWEKYEKLENVENDIYRRVDQALQRIRKSKSRIRIIVEDLHELQNGDEVACMLHKIALESGGKIHFVITSRLSYWNRYSADVIKGSVCLITPEMLLFNEDDISEYLKLSGIPTEPKIVSYLYKKTEGWAIFLSLMVNEYIRNGTSVVNSDISDYIMNVEDESIMSDERVFAKEIVIMDRFTVSQAERFTGCTDSADMIRNMRFSNMYIMYDVRDNSFRFIEPYRQYLLGRLAAEKNDDSIWMKKRLKIAGDIMSDDGNFVKAVDYYYRSGEFELMMSAIEKGQHIGSDEEKRSNYIKYYKDCPREIRSRYHLAMLYMAWRFFNFGELELYRESSLEFLEDLYSDRNLSEKEKNSLLCDYSIFRAMTDFDDLDKVKQDYDNALAVFDGVKRTEHSVIPRTYGSTAVIKLLYNGGSLDRTLDMIDEISENGKKLIGNGWLGVSCEAKAEAAFMKLDLDMTEIMMNRAERECIESPERSMGVRVCSIFLKTRLAVVRGEFSPANNPLRDFLEKESDIMMSPLKKTAEVCQAWISIQLGDAAGIPAWLRTGDFSDVDLLYPAMPSIYLMHMYVLLFLKKYNKLLSYNDMFFGKSSICRNLVIREAAYLVIATAWNEIGKTYKARECLKSAFKLVKETENMASVVIYGVDLVPLIRQLPEEYSDEAEKALHEIGKFVANRDRCRAAMRGSRFRNLTKRETQVASCAASGLINREIAEKLGISENTVKTTLQKIYSKLDITSRRQLAESMKDTEQE